MDGWLDARMSVCLYVHMYVWALGVLFFMFVCCMFVRMYVCMQVCTYVCINVCSCQTFAGIHTDRGTFYLHMHTQKLTAGWAVRGLIDSTVFDPAAWGSLEFTGGLGFSV